MLQKKPSNRIPKRVQQVFNLISFRQDNPIIMGCAGFKNIKYPADYDLFETVYEGKQSLQQFKQRVKSGFI